MVALGNPSLRDAVWIDILGCSWITFHTAFITPCTMWLNDHRFCSGENYAQNWKTGWLLMCGSCSSHHIDRTIWRELCMLSSSQNLLFIYVYFVWMKYLTFELYCRNCWWHWWPWTDQTTQQYGNLRKSSRATFSMLLNIESLFWHCFSILMRWSSQSEFYCCHINRV